MGGRFVGENPLAYAHDFTVNARGFYFPFKNVNSSRNSMNTKVRLRFFSIHLASDKEVLGYTTNLARHKRTCPFASKIKLWVLSQTLFSQINYGMNSTPVMQQV